MRTKTNRGSNTPAKPKPKKKTSTKPKNKRWHPKFGTSKLETDFARDFLDKLGVDYVWQFEAKDIGRFYDFKIVDGPIIEINGSYWHGDSRIYEEKDLNRMQKHSQYVDKIKAKWALMNGIPIYYIWEKDIKENPKWVMDELKKILRIENEKKIIAEGKKQRHVNKLNKK